MNKKLIIFIILSTLFLANSQEVTAQIADRVCKLYEDNTSSLDKQYKEKKQLYENDKTKSAQELIQDQIDSKNNYFIQWRENKISDEDLLKEILYEVLPLAVMLVLSILGYLAYIFFYFADCCCQKCICCKKKDGDYSKFELAWPISGIMMFSVWVIFASGFGIHKASTIGNGYYMFKCQFMTFLESFDGVGDGEDWVGLTTLGNSLTEIENDFTQKVDATFGTSGDFIEPGYTSIKTSIGDAVETEITYNSITKPGTNSLDGGYFHNNRYGNENYETQTGTYLYSFDQVYISLATLKNSLLKAQNDGLAIKTGGFKQSIQTGNQNLQDLQKQIDDAAVDLDDQTSSIDEDIIPLIEDATMYYFVVCLGVSVLAIISTILVVPLKLRKMRVLMHVSWCVFTLAMIIGFAISTALWAVSWIGFQACDATGKAMSDREEMRKLDLFDEKTLDYIQTCTEKQGGNGQILATLGVYDELEQMRGLSDSIAASSSSNQDSQKYFTQLNDQITLCQSDLESIDLSGNYVDPSNSANKIYFVDNADLVPASCANVELAHDENSCQTQTYQDNLNGSPASCIAYTDYNDFMKPAGQNDAFPANYNCLNTEINLFQWADQVSDYTDINLVDTNNIKNAFNKYKTDSDGYITLVNGFDKSVDGTMTDLDNLLGKDGEANTGQAKCLFVGEGFVRVNDALCVEMIPDMYWLTVNLIINSVGMFCGCFFLYCAGFRFAQLKKKDEEDERKKNYETTKAPDYN